MKKDFLVLVLSLMVISFAQAQQVVNADEKKPQKASITKSSLSRISISGGRIARTKYIDGELEVEQDRIAGEIYVRSLTPRVSSIFVTSDEGKTYLLVLSPNANTADSIVIDGKGYQDKLDRLASVPLPPQPVTTKSSEYIRAIKQLMVSMINNTTGDMGVYSSVKYETIPLWKNTLFVKTSQYTAADMQAESFTLTNIGSEAMSVREQEFYKPGVYAVTVRKQVLQSGEQTDIYVIRKLGGDF